MQRIETTRSPIEKMIPIRAALAIMTLLFSLSFISACSVFDEDATTSDIDDSPQIEVVNAGEESVCELAMVDPTQAEIEDEDIIFDGELTPGERYSIYDLETGSFDLLAFGCDNFEVVDEQLDVEVGQSPVVWTIGAGTESAIQISEPAGEESDGLQSAMGSNADIATGVTGEDIRVVPLGNLGESGQVTLTVPEGDVSLLFTAIAADPTDQIIVESVIGPNGESLYTLSDWEQDEFESDMFKEALFGDGEIVFYLPVAPQFELQPGAYQITLSTIYGDPIPDAFVVFRSGDVDGPQAVDMNVWLVSEDPNVTSPEGQSTLSAIIRKTVDKVLSQQDLRLGQLNFFAANDAQLEAFARSTEDDQAESCQALAGIAGAGRALNVILIDELAPSPVADDVDVGDDIAGLSPSPGSILVPASGTSCVTVAWEIHERDFDDLGATIVHEGSHFLSLQHTSEQDGEVFDVLADTLECGADQFDDNGDGIVDQFECEQADGANYMFWGSEGLTTDFVISEDQAWVLRRHPLFYPIER